MRPADRFGRSPVIYRFRVGQYVKVAHIVDDLVCKHLGLTGVVAKHLGIGAVRGEARYWIEFKDGIAHAFYESELEEVA